MSLALKLAEKDLGKVSGELQVGIWESTGSVFTDLMEEKDALITGSGGLRE